MNTPLSCMTICVWLFMYDNLLAEALKKKRGVSADIFCIVIDKFSLKLGRFFM